MKILSGKIVSTLIIHRIYDKMEKWVKKFAKIKAKNEYVQNLILRYFGVLRKYCRQRVKNAACVTEGKVLNRIYFC